MRLKAIGAFLALGVFLGLPLAVSACPACAEAIAASDTPDDDANNFPSAMNQSIYLMVGVPYIALGGVGFIIYRGMKKNADYFGNQEGQQDRG